MDGILRIRDDLRLSYPTLRALPIFAAQNPDDGHFYMASAPRTVNVEMGSRPHGWLIAFRYGDGEVQWPVDRDWRGKMEIVFNPLRSPAKWIREMNKCLHADYSPVNPHSTYITYVAQSHLTPFVRSYGAYRMGDPLGRFSRGIKKMSREDQMVQKLSKMLKTSQRQHGEQPNAWAVSPGFVATLQAMDGE